MNYEVTLFAMDAVSPHLPIEGINLFLKVSNVEQILMLLFEFDPKRWRVVVVTSFIQTIISQ